MIIDRLDAKSVSNEVERLLFSVEKCERELAAQQRERRRAFHLVEIGDDLDIGTDVAIDPGLAHELCKLPVVVDLTVANCEYRTRGVADGLRLGTLEER
jgi:hypothetical protein